jgi:hypothetical protein
MGKRNQATAKKRANAYIRSTGGTRLAVRNGRLDGSRSTYDRPGGGNFDPTFTSGGSRIDRRSANKTNRYLDRTGYSLKGGGAPVVGFRKVKTTTATRTERAGAGPDGYQAPSYTPTRGVEMVPIYGKGGGGGRGASAGKSSASAASGGSSRGAAHGSAQPASSPAAAASQGQPSAEDIIYARDSAALPPPLFPVAPAPGQAAEGVADFSNRLRVYNQNMLGAMNDRAQASQAQNTVFLSNFQAGLPAAPQFASDEDLYATAERFKKLFG